MEALGKENVWMFPQWLPNLIETEFYGPCEAHARLECNFFCTGSQKQNPTCCKACASSEAGDHGYHQHLQVYKASYRPAVLTSEMDKYAVVIKDIQTYSINSKSVIYIRRKDDKAQSGKKRNCDCCGHGLKEDAPNSAKFCSLQCKLEFWKCRPNFLLTKLIIEEESMMVARRGYLLFQVAPESNRPPETEKSDSGPKTDVHSFRKRPRKGIPRRSPFF